MRQPLFSVGQPVFIRWCYNTPYNIIEVQDRKTHFSYKLRARNGVTEQQHEDLIEPLKLDRHTAKFCITRVA